jgi:hypothetical protein
MGARGLSTGPVGPDGRWTRQSVITVELLFHILTALLIPCLDLFFMFTLN